MSDVGRSDSIRSRPNRDFTIIRNAAMRDPLLSLQAKGLLALMMTHAETYTYRMSGLEKQSRNGRDAHQTAMRELIEAGYVRRYAKQTPEGKLAGWEWEVTDEPLRSTVSLETRQTENPNDGKPAPKKTKTEEDQDNQKTKSQEHVQSVEIEAVPPPARPVPVGRNGEVIREAVAIWNEESGPLPKAAGVTDKRRQTISRMLRDFSSPEEALFALRLATRNVARDPWWRDHAYNLDNLLVTGRVLERAEKEAAAMRGSEADALAGHLRAGDEEKKEAERRRKADAEREAAIFGSAR